MTIGPALSQVTPNKALHWLTAPHLSRLLQYVVNPLRWQRQRQVLESSELKRQAAQRTVGTVAMDTCVNVGRTFTLICLAAISSGCVSQEGIGFQKRGFVERPFVKYGALPGEPRTSENRLDRMILVGNLSSLRRYDGEDYEEAYRKYSESYKSWGSSRPPRVSEQQFASEFAGWTKIQVLKIPLIGAAYAMGLVPKKLLPVLDFEHRVDVSFAQSTEDLVAAISNDDGVFVLSRLLCKRDEYYTECSANYERGIFDSVTGKKIDGKMRFEDPEVQIDLKTFRVL